MFHLNSDQLYLVLQESHLIKPLDKLAHNASSQSQLWEARHTIPEFNEGNPRYKGNTQGGQ